MSSNSMERSFDSDMEDYRKDDRDRSRSADCLTPSLEGGRTNRAMWWSRFPGTFNKKDRMGVVWAKNAIIDENSLLKDDREFRAYTAGHLGNLGCGDREEYKIARAFLFSLTGLVRREDLDFVLDSRVWNFLLACWVKDIAAAGESSTSAWP